MDNVVKTLQLMEAFEKRNNISVSLILQSDGSSILEEFWEKEELQNSSNIDELHAFLRNVAYDLDDDGRCYSPVRVIVGEKYVKLTPDEGA